MSSNSLKVLKMVEIEPPALLLECINDELFEKVNMQPIAVCIKKTLGEWRGLCPYLNETTTGEIAIAEELFDVRSKRLRENQLKEIVDVYLHECAHRLTHNCGHDASFLCLNMILHLRAGNKQIHKVNIYDVHQEKYIKDAWAWAWQLAIDLYETDQTAENCAEIVMKKYAEWVTWMDGADERQDEAELLKQLAINKQKKEAHHINNRIKILQQDRWYFAIASMVITTLLLTFLK